MGLGNEEIIQNLKRVCGWFHANVKNPSHACMECEAALVQFMAFTYDNLAKKLPVEEIKKSVKHILEDMVRSRMFAPN